MSELRQKMIRAMDLKNLSEGSKRSYLLSVTRLAKHYNASPDNITEEMIEAGMSEGGGWSRRQFACFGVEWPPHKGWKREIIRRKIDRASADRFVALRKENRDQLDLF